MFARVLWLLLAPAGEARLAGLHALKGAAPGRRQRRRRWQDRQRQWASAPVQKLLKLPTRTRGPLNEGQTASELSLGWVDELRAGMRLLQLFEHYIGQWKCAGIEGQP